MLGCDFIYMYQGTLKKTTKKTSEKFAYITYELLINIDAIVLRSKVIACVNRV